MRLKGIHDIKTRHSLGIGIRRINVNIEHKDMGRGKAFRPHVWTFTTKPHFTRILGVEEVEEPALELIKEADEITVIARLPGVKEEDIKIDVEGDILSLSAEIGKEKMYTKELLLPWVVETKNMGWSYEDEILEIKLKKSRVNRQ